MKRIVFTKHALQRLQQRGTTIEEVEKAILEGSKEQAKNNKRISRLNFAFNSVWQQKQYAVKQVAPVFVEESEQIVVITIYTYFF